MATSDSYPSQGWQQGRQDPNYVQPSNGVAVAALVLGILAVVFFWTVIGGILLGLIGLILGIVGIRKARAGRAPRRAMAIIGTVLSALGIIGGAGILIAGVSILNSDSFKSYSDCVQHAHSQSAKDKCTRDFKDRSN
ncbi:DUF4190 domain-containing protein [Streptomyces sp. NBC_00859]|uniref:DUF4190 domain-containing protein n=1 Tax=Streptomyces sp. NBC_00859 TaxID=2903682 RepID=UPI00386E96E1|nr:DUF4190 domain-containing protein [Streptomyces sp. NBC_00859]